MCKEKSKEKIMVNKTIGYVNKNEPVTWADVKHIKFEDGDVINAGYQEETHHSNGGESDHFYFTVNRDVPETDDEFKNRQQWILFDEKRNKERRLESYLKLKQEFDDQVWEKALVSLTPGGSEFCGDPKYCVEYIKGLQENQHRMLVEIVKEKKNGK